MNKITITLSFSEFILTILLSFNVGGYLYSKVYGKETSHIRLAIYALIILYIIVFLTELLLKLN